MQSSGPVMGSHCPLNLTKHGWFAALRGPLPGATASEGPTGREQGHPLSHLSQTSFWSPRGQNPVGCAGEGSLWLQPRAERGRGRWKPLQANGGQSPGGWNRLRSSGLTSPGESLCINGRSGAVSQQRSRCREQPGCREEPDSGPGSPSMCDFGWIPCLRAVFISFSEGW